MCPHLLTIIEFWIITSAPKIPVRDLLLQTAQVETVYPRFWAFTSQLIRYLLRSPMDFHTSSFYRYDGLVAKTPVLHRPTAKVPIAKDNAQGPTWHSGLAWGWVVWSCLLAVATGCAGDALPPNPATTGQPLQQTVVAQGQILPQGGIVQLSAPPGDVVLKRLVDVGDHVSPGQVLLEMRSQESAAANLRTLQKRREVATQERKLALAAAQRQVKAATLKLEHVRSQQQSLERKHELVELAQEQVTAAERVLGQLESIAANAATREFVGQLEIDRQRINVSQAQLSFRQQSEAQRQAVEDLNWSLRAAEEEQAAAEEQLQAAQTQQTLEVIDLEIEALREQATAARITAPIAGVVLAVNASVGEASIPLPVIELANLEELVCEVEINELDAALVEPGQAATITSRALGDKQLNGRVLRKFKLVGRPQLRSPDPLARVDYRTVTALIELDQASASLAKDWLQLQVAVAIDITKAPR